MPGPLTALRARSLTAARPVWEPGGILFPAQQRVFNDNARFRAAMCSRRAGKSHLAIVELIDAAKRRPDSLCVYIGLTREAAKKDIWRDLLTYGSRYGIDWKIDLTELSLTLDNGSVIRLRGLADRSEIEWFRGTKYDLVVIDELQSQGAYVRELLEDIIGPALLDRGGRVLLIGTPGWLEAGFWWEVVNGEQRYSIHSWTLRDNPTLNGVEEFLADQAVRLGGETVPKFLREYGGVWVRDPSGMVYHFDRELNYWDVLPGPLTEAQSVIGVDTGTVDSDAINVWSWWQHDPNLYQTAEIVASKQSWDQLIVQVQGMVESFKPLAIVIDPAYGGKKAIDTIAERYGTFIEVAEKQRKLEHAEFLDTDLRTGRIKCMRPRTDEAGRRTGGRLADDLCVIQWDKKAAEKGERKIADKPHSDIGDAALYSHRRAKHFWFQPVRAPLSDEEAQRERLRAEIAEIEAQRGDPWHDGDPYGLYR